MRQEMENYHVYREQYKRRLIKNIQFQRMAINLPKVLWHATVDLFSASGTFPPKGVILYFEKLNNLKKKHLAQKNPVIESQL
jgi:hypothetical protein